MGILQKLFNKFTPKTQVIEFVQARNFRGFKRYKISNYDYDEAQANIQKIKAINPKMDFNGCKIRLEHVTCSTSTDALAVFVADLRIGTIFFGDGNYAELKDAFYNSKLSAACVRTEDSENYYLFVKIEKE